MHRKRRLAGDGQGAPRGDRRSADAKGRGQRGLRLHYEVRAAVGEGPDRPIRSHRIPQAARRVEAPPRRAGVLHAATHIRDDRRRRGSVAVNAIMGHADPRMAAIYRERIDDERLVAVAEHVQKVAVRQGEAEQNSRTSPPQLARRRLQKQPPTREVSVESQVHWPSIGKFPQAAPGR